MGNPPDSTRHCHLCPPYEAAYNGIISVDGYRPAASRSTLLFKHHRRMEMGRFLARLMSRRLARPISILGGRIDCIIPVPLHWRRRLWRGMNQSDILGSEMALQWGLPYEPRLLRRTRHTRRQALLPKEDRAKNVEGRSVRPEGRRSRVGGSSWSMTWSPPVIRSKHARKY
jgi:predicted amidophosphoribosyltransferase